MAVVTTLRCQSAPSPVKQPSASNPYPVRNHQARDAQTRDSSPSCACGVPLPPPGGVSGISVRRQHTQREAAPGLFPNLQGGEVVDIQDSLRSGSSSPPSRGVPEHDFSGGTSSVGTCRPLALPKPSTSEVQRNLESPWQRRIDEFWGSSLYVRFDFLCFESPSVSTSVFDSWASCFLSLLSFLTFAIPTFLY